MEKIENLYLSDEDGDEYIFEVYPAGTRFHQIPGVYVFTKRDANQHRGCGDILYIGATSSFKNRPVGWGHFKCGLAQSMGMTHVCVMEVLDEDNRKSVEIALIAAYNSPLNVNKM